jgi:hypothetical protein
MRFGHARRSTTKLSRLLFVYRLVLFGNAIGSAVSVIEADLFVLYLAFFLRMKPQLFSQLFGEITHA